MDRIITENDLLLYHYKEVDTDIHQFITSELPSHTDWMDYLSLLTQIDLSLNQQRKSPAATTLRIILEESQHQENPTF
jgi:hypothetical protein